MDMDFAYKSCRLCGRECGVDRSEKQGFCLSGTVPTLSRADLHMWEEPCISGVNGSGTIFFTGCNLKCVYCFESGRNCNEKMSEETQENVFKFITDTLITRKKERLKC